MSSISCIKNLTKNNFCCVFIAQENLVYNSTFENEWCEVVVTGAKGREPKEKFHLSDEVPSRPYENMIDAETEDWRTQTGLSLRSQGWGQQSGTITLLISLIMDFIPVHTFTIIFI